MMYNDNWQYFTIGDYNNIPSKYINWLIRPFVLSDALKRVCSKFEVKCISQEFGFMNDDEAEVLNCTTLDLGMVRQTLLIGDDKNLVYARVAIPKQTYIHNRDMLRIIGDKPIGASFLYNNPKISRSIFQFKLLTPGDQLFQNAVVGLQEKPNELWARRSIFYVYNDPMIISEVFFENIPHYVFNEDKDEILSYIKNGR